MQTQPMQTQSAQRNGLNQATAGFRLQKLEVLNWGTFDQRPWTLDLRGGIGLLTGANGSGKSTLVDGILTLLVPNRGRNYNQASSASSKKERNEKSYVQGAFGRTRAEDSYGSKAKFLREKSTLSVLLAFFHDQANQQDVTLAQVLWMQSGSVHKFFAIADRELSIVPDFTQAAQIAELKRQLKASDVHLFQDFTKYSQQFRKRLGLQSEKALDLFNQTVSIKEIGGLNDFVRNHMLEKTEVQTRIRELQESYENLTISHTAIQNARKQLESLQPLAEESDRYQLLQKDVARSQRLQELVPLFFARKKLTLLEAELQQVAHQLAQVQDQRTEAEQHLESLRQREKELEFAIQQDSVGQRLQTLKRELELCETNLTQTKQQAERHHALVQQLGFSEVIDRDSFYAARQAGELLKQDIDAAFEALEAERDRQKLESAELEKQRTQLADELESLRSRKSQIPYSSLKIRNSLVKALKLNEATLPFVGELLQVRPEAEAWEGAIERLLRGFGLCLLVPNDLYSAVNTYVNRTHLQGRLVYYRVQPQSPNPTQRALDPNRIPHKIEIKQDNPAFYHWLREQLERQFNYVCCDTIEQFERETRAITQKGLIKHGSDRHEKDDRNRIGDRRHYILGWDNASKIEALEIELKQTEAQLKQIQQMIGRLERQRRQRQQQQVWLQDFMNVTEFSRIDWRSLERVRQDLEAQRQQLEASSDRLKDLEAQLKATQSDLDQADQHREALIREIQTLENRQAQAQKEQVQCQAQLESTVDSEIDFFAAQLPKKLKRYALTLETIAHDQTNMQSFLQDKLRQQESKLNSAQSALTMGMLNFKNAFPEITSDMGTSLDYLDEYLALKTQIEQDDLPRHEKRFRALMNEKVIIAISMFKSALEKQEEDIRLAIDELNESLQTIDYTDSTYIKLCCDTTRNREIRDFKEDLKVCLGDIAKQSAEDNEIRFENIRQRLIERFKSEDRWTSLVTDVRKWLDFSVSERYRADHSEKEHHTDSSGKSGGQKVKLAYTILASAIAYQFGLNQESLKHKSFRFVVIDEAFSKSDDSNARYAMELFQNLNLQLLVVTPKDKINVIEPYISSLHFVSNTPEGDCSSIASIAIEEYRHNRQLALTNA